VEFNYIRSVVMHNQTESKPHTTRCYLTSGMNFQVAIEQKESN